MRGISHKLPLACALISYLRASSDRGEAFIRKIDFREDGLQTLSKRHILCYDKREELLPGGNSPGAAEYIQIYYNLL